MDRRGFLKALGLSVPAAIAGGKAAAGGEPDFPRINGIAQYATILATREAMEMPDFKQRFRELLGRRMVVEQIGYGTNMVEFKVIGEEIPFRPEGCTPVCLGTIFTGITI